MKVRVGIEMCVEVNDPVFAELSAIHADVCGVGESEQLGRNPFGFVLFSLGSVLIIPHFVTVVKREFQNF